MFTMPSPRIILLVSLVATTATVGGWCRSACAQDATEPAHLSDRVEVPPVQHVGWDENWQRMTWVDYTLTAALVVGSLEMHDYIVPGSRSNWVGRVIFDDEVRSHLALGPQGQQIADQISDAGLYTSPGLSSTPSLRSSSMETQSWPGR